MLFGDEISCFTSTCSLGREMWRNILRTYTCGGGGSGGRKTRTGGGALSPVVTSDLRVNVHSDDNALLCSYACTLPITRTHARIHICMHTHARTNTLPITRIHIQAYARTHARTHTYIILADMHARARAQRLA